jgi:hypothetical protein
MWVSPVRFAWMSKVASKVANTGCQPQRRPDPGALREPEGRRPGARDPAAGLDHYRATRDVQGCIQDQGVSARLQALAKPPFDSLPKRTYTLSEEGKAHGLPFS